MTDEPNHSIGHYKELWREAGHLVPRDTSPEACRTISKLASQCRQVHRAIGRKKWNRGEGEVPADTLEDIEEMEDLAKDLVVQAREAHGNAQASEYESWAERFLEDLDRLSFEAIDFSEKLVDEAQEGRDHLDTLEGKIDELQQKVDLYGEKFDQIESEGESGEQGDFDRDDHVSVKEVKRDLQRLNDKVDEALEADDVEQKFVEKNMSSFD